MNKSVANLHHVERVARAANQRYLEALSVVNDPAPTARWNGLPSDRWSLSVHTPYRCVCGLESRKDTYRLDKT
jgi:hypothetical protein